MSLTLFRTLTLSFLVLPLLVLSACQPIAQEGVLINDFGPRLEDVCYRGVRCIIYHRGSKGGLSCDFSKRCDIAPMANDEGMTLPPHE